MRSDREKKIQFDMLEKEAATARSEDMIKNRFSSSLDLSKPFDVDRKFLQILQSLPFPFLPFGSLHE